jgi:Cu/Ag efflux protein CusF
LSVAFCVKNALQVTYIHASLSSTNFPGYTRTLALKERKGMKRGDRIEMGRDGKGREQIRRGRGDRGN